MGNGRGVLIRKPDTKQENGKVFQSKLLVLTGTCP